MPFPLHGVGIDNSFIDFSFRLHTVRDNVVVGETMFVSVMNVASGASSERKNVPDTQEIIHEMLGMIAQCTPWLKTEREGVAVHTPSAGRWVASNTTFSLHSIISIKFPFPCVFAVEQIKCSHVEQKRLLRNVYDLLTSQWRLPLVRTAATAAAHIKLLSIWELVAFLCAFYEATIYRIQIFNIESEWYVRH